MNDPSIQELIYSDPVEEFLYHRDLDDYDDDAEYDDLSFSALLDSSNDF